MTVRGLIQAIMDNAASLDEEVEVRDNQHVYREVDRVGRIAADKDNEAAVSVQLGDEV